MLNMTREWTTKRYDVKYFSEPMTKKVGIALM